MKAAGLRKLHGTAVAYHPTMSVFTVMMSLSKQSNSKNQSLL